MKWLGQHIVDLIARFKSSIYLDGIETGTIASGGNLGLDSNNKIVKAVDSDTTYSEATSSAEGLMSTAHHDKLDGIETGATADQTQADINALNITAADLAAGNQTIDGDITIGGNDSTTHEIKRAARTSTTATGAALQIFGGDAVGTDQAGGNLFLYGGKGTGTAVGGNIYFYVSPPTGDSDADLNPQNRAMLYSGNDGSLTLGGDLNGLRDNNLTISSDQSIKFKIDADDDESGKSFAFYNASTEIANLDESGNLQIDGDLTLSGLDIKNADDEVVISLEADQDTVFFKDIFFGQDTTTATKMRRTPRSTSGNGGTFYINAGDAYGANNDGGNFQIVAGAGTGTGVGGDFQFLSYNGAGAGSTLNTAAMMQPALLTQTGNLTIAGDLTITGGNITNAITFDSGITDAGTIAAGTWNGGVIASDKLDTDTAHLSEDQTFTGVKEINSRKYAYPGTSDGDHLAGDIMYYDSGTATTVAGKIYYFNGSGSWTIANADAEADASGMLAVALGNNPDVDGMLLRGFVTLYDINGTEDHGAKLYLHTADGEASATAPGSGNMVRIIGYNLHNTNDSVYFNPDNTWVEVS